MSPWLAVPMPLSVRRWKQFAESRYAHEREALEFLRDALPDRDPIYLYSNFEFISDDGSVNEIDALVVTQAGVFLVEVKSRGGIVSGNRHLWDWSRGRPHDYRRQSAHPGEFQST